MVWSVVAARRKCNGGLLLEGSRFEVTGVYCERVHKPTAIVREEIAMRLTALTTILVLGAVACGGERKSGASQAQAAAPAPANAAPAAEQQKGPVVEVKMTGNATTQAAFDPVKLTIKPGTTVRF